MAATYFHVCPIPLEEGSVICPGNFGRVINQYRPRDLGTLASRELSFEIVRLQHFPARPSRLTSIFLLPTVAHATVYRHQYAFSSLIYEVEPIDEKEVFNGDMSLITTLFPTEFTPAIPFMMDLARQYWTGLGEIQQTSELLTEAAVRIVRRLDIPDLIVGAPGATGS